MHIFPGYVAASICLSSTLRFSETILLMMYLITIIYLCSLWQKWKKQLSSCRMLLQSMSSVLFFLLSNTQEIVYFCIKENTAEDWNLIFFWYFSCFLLMAMNLQELDCCGWAWKGDIFLWWVGNCMELLWTPSFCQSVKTSNPLLTTFTVIFSYSLVL